jgi:hypothetical protein
MSFLVVITLLLFRIDYVLRSLNAKEKNEIENSSIVITRTDKEEEYKVLQSNPITCTNIIFSFKLHELTTIVNNVYSYFRK